MELTLRDPVIEGALLCRDATMSPSPKWTDGGKSSANASLALTLDSLKRNSSVPVVISERKFSRQCHCNHLISSDLWLLNFTCSDYDLDPGNSLKEGPCWGSLQVSCHESLGRRQM